MRNPIGYIALSLLAAAFAGCSSTDTGSTSSPSSSGGDLTGALAQFNAQIKPLANACSWDNTAGKATYTLAADEIAVFSLRAVDSALMANGTPCTYVDATSSATVTVVNKNLKALAVNGSASGDETAIIDIRNGLFAKGAIAIDLKAHNSGKDEVAVLGSTGADKIICSQDTSTNDQLDLNGDKTADVVITKNTITNNKITIDLSDGADTFTQGACVTATTVYGGAGADTIYVGSDKHSGDVFSGGTDPGTTDSSVDVISYASRTAGVTVDLNTTLAALGVANDGDTGTSEADNVIDDFETLTGGDGADVLTTGTHVLAYTINGGAGNDTLASKQDHGVVFNGGAGTDTVTYAARGVAVTVTMDGSKADDGEKTGATTATLDNVKGDVENLIGSPQGDTITGNALPNVITPGAGADVVTGGDGDDVFVAADTDGNDQFIGGNGTDTADYSARTASVCLILDGVMSSGTFSGTHSGACTTTISGTTTVAPTWSNSSGSESDILGADVENAVGSSADDHIIGNASANMIYGMGGTDKLEGLGGNDVLDGNLYASANGYFCNPITFACDASGTGACDCATTASWTIDATASCPHSAANVKSALDGGGDAMDVGTCASATAGMVTNCWKTQ